jgi:ankyrin repeat protein
VKVLSAIDESTSVINSADEEGWAPLHSAASIGNLEIVEVLLSRGRSLYFLLKVVSLELLFLMSRLVLHCIVYLWI